MLQDIFILGADFEWVRIVFVVGAVIVWVLVQAVKSAASPKSPNARRNAPVERDDWHDDEQDEAPGSDPLSDEIEAFLAKVRGEEPSAPPAPQPRQQAPPPIRAEPVRPVAAPIQATALEATLSTEQAGGAIEDRFTHETSRLGSDVEQADERAEQHRHEAFDHKLGNLQDTSVAGDGVPDTVASESEEAEEVVVPMTASDIRELLGTPESIRKAVVLNEILGRPTDRW